MTAPSPSQARGGRENCLACNSPDQEAINADLLAGLSLRQLAVKHGIGYQALFTHKRKHLSSALVALPEESPGGTSGSSVLEHLDRMLAETKRIRVVSRQAGNVQHALRCIRTEAELLHLKAKITGAIDERMQVTIRIWQTQEWLQVRVVILAFVEETLGVKQRVELDRMIRLVEDAA